MFIKRVVPMVLISCLLATYLPLASDTSVDNVSIDTSAADAAISYESKGNTSVGASSIDVPAVGEVNAANDPMKEATQAELEKMITAVKLKISIPKELTQFEYNFNTENYNSSAIWNLNWHNKDYSKQINVQSDQKGNILNYYINDNNDGYYAPKYLKSELKTIATKFIKNTSPDIYDGIEYVGVQSQGTNSGQYIYQFQRVENKIAMPDNMITVGVNFETGKVVSYSASWLYDVKIPSAEVLVTEKEAVAKIGKEVKMKLAYQNAYTTDDNGKTTIKAFLVYAPDQSYVAVDAKTGEIYTTQNEWIEKNQYGSTKEEAQDSAKSAAGFTPEEILKVEELAGLISRKDAINAVTENKSLLLDKNLKSISANLYKQSNQYFKESNDSKETKYVWNITLSDPREIDKDSKINYRAYASATVDAKTGKLISFNSSVKDYYNMTKEEWESVKVKYSSEQSKVVLEDFFKTQIPDLFKNSVLTDNQESYVIAYKDEKEVYGGYYYQYDRVNEKINYSYNGIYGSVDGVTGKIYSFSYNWDENVTFESPKNIITAKQAFDYYIASDGFDLVYEINNLHTVDSDYNAKDGDMYYDSSDAYSLENEVRLVHRTNITPAYISPFTGKQLNEEGKEYNVNENNYSYSDIKNQDSARSILLLADIGIGFSGGKFIPEQAITTKELGKFLSLTNYYYNTDKYKLKNDNSTITRLYASKFIIQILGYENIAKIKGIYSTDFKDLDQISDANIGYVALAQGLKIITSNSKNEFKPDIKLTRAQASDMILAMLSVEK